MNKKLGIPMKEEVFTQKKAGENCEIFIMALINKCRSASAYSKMNNSFQQNVLAAADDKNGEKKSVKTHKKERKKWRHHTFPIGI